MEKTTAMQTPSGTRGMPSDDKIGASPHAANNREVSFTVALDGWLTAAEAARYLKVKRRSLLLWVRQGRIKAYALSGTRRRVWRFRKHDLDSTLLSRDSTLLPRAVVISETPAAPAERKDI
jgi:excisionase family DNA binding protein